MRGETILRLPQFDGLTFDWRVVGVASTVALTCGVLFGLLPSLIRRSTLPGADLKEGGRSVTGAGGWLRTTLSAAQVGGSIVLVIGSLLLLQSLRNLARVDVGFEQDAVQVFAVDPQNLGYSWEEVNLLRDRLLEQTQVLPGVESASISSGTPFGGGFFMGRFAVVEDPDQPLIRAFAPSTTPEYLRTLGIPLIQGEPLSPATHPDGVVISRSLARQLFGDGPAVGRQVTDRRANPEVYTIVGVAGDTRMVSLRAEPDMVMYRPMSELMPFETYSYLLVRSRLDHATTERQIGEILAGIDPSLTIYRTELLSETVASTIGEERMVARLMVGLTVLALLLASVGVYSVASYAVAQRARELGIRMALGARAGSIARLVLRGSITIAAVGILAGALGAAWATRILESMLFEVERLDPVVFAVAAVAIAAVAIGATMLPVRAAVRLDPMETIRAD